MSAKWVRSKAWDDRHLTGALTPVKWLLRTFSSVYFGVTMLVLVAMYGILASVPIGLIALAPTWAVYGLSLLVTIVLVAALPLWTGLGVMGKRGAGPIAKFVVGLVGGLVLVIAAVVVWRALVWPQLRWDALTHNGFRMFGSFVDQYKTTQFRRLPVMEMSELEFYSWWPLRLVLALFVTNMVVATVRRIEFSFPHVGVITVHTGIVTIGLGSIYYSTHKQEGDVLLVAGQASPDGTPSIAGGRPETGFYDNTRTALWVQQVAGKQGAMDPTRAVWEQRGLPRIPRYHEYNINVLGLKSLPPIMASVVDQGPLSIDVPGGGGGQVASDGTPVDSDIKFRVIGYAPYAELIARMMRASEIDAAKLGSQKPEAVRTVEAYLNLPPDPENPDTEDPSKPRKVWRLMPDAPARRVDVMTVEDQPLLGVEYTRGMSEQRWKDLASPLPRGTQHAVVVRHPASGFSAVYPVRQGSTITVGETGYTLSVDQLLPEPPFALVTKGYQGAKSSVAIVHVQPPAASGASAFQRWVYHRFPEISQDLVDGAGGQMGQRRNADPALEIDYIDASIIQIYLDEAPATDGKSSNAVRALVRLPAGDATITPNVEPGGTIEISKGFSLKLTERFDDALRVEFPVPVPEAQRDSKSIGAHQRASLAVEVSATVDGQPWKMVQWLPFAQYLDIGGQSARIITLPDGRAVKLAFGRARHEFWPPMAIALADFEMIPYPHSQTPRDYRSDVIVMNRWHNDQLEQLRRKTSLNDPLLVRTPFQPADGVPGWAAPIVNGIGWAFSKIAPNQYKFSQAGWDQEGWTSAVAAVERGELKRPFARYTILGVGNNPGIYIIAAGAVMMSVGIPWAFYLKPVIMRRRKKKIQAQLAAGTYVRPGKKLTEVATNGEAHAPAEKDAVSSTMEREA